MAGSQDARSHRQSLLDSLVSSKTRCLTYSASLNNVFETLSRFRTRGKVDLLEDDSVLILDQRLQHSRTSFRTLGETLRKIWCSISFGNLPM